MKYSGFPEDFIEKVIAGSYKLTRFIGLKTRFEEMGLDCTAAYIDGMLGPGPWSGEPDEDSWIDSYSSFKCSAWRNKFGVWCGYVYIPNTHKLFGVNYDDVDIYVYEGLTYSGIGENGMWRFGFDTAHCYDFIPGTEIIARQMGRPRTAFDPSMTDYKTLDFIKTECASLAKQLYDSMSPMEKLSEQIGDFDE